MGKVYFTKYSVVPDRNNPQMKELRYAWAYTMVVADDENTVLAKSNFLILRSGWLEPQIELPPRIVQPLDFIGQQREMVHFEKAIKFGHSVYFVAHSDSCGESFEQPLETSSGINIPQMWKDKKRIAKKKRCLHFNAGSECDQIISAHSVQKKRSLSAIAENGHVYQVSPSAFRKQNDRKAVYSLIGINKATTFLGFCKFHDNALFKPIDDFDLKPDEEQAVLYAYRSLCREIFVKQNAIEQAEQVLQHNPDINPANRFLFNGSKTGNQIGLASLMNAKDLFEDVLKTSKWQDIKYTAFVINDAPNMAFSGGLFPDFDFLGNQLQDIIDISTPNHVITFCSAPIANGWAMIFTWHEAHDWCCSRFMESFKKVIREGQNPGTVLFRFIVQNCENIAFKPSWFDNLAEKQRAEIEGGILARADSLTAVNPEYLTGGFDGAVCWKIAGVSTNTQ